MSDDNSSDTNVYLKKPWPDTWINADGKPDCALGQVESHNAWPIDCSTAQAVADSRYVTPFYRTWVATHPRDMAAVQRRAAERARRDAIEDAERLKKEAARPDLASRLREQFAP